MKDWFPHNYGAHLDDKVLQLIKKHGITAYGLYWIIIENLYEFGGSYSRVRVESRLSLVADRNQLRTSSTQIDTMIELGLLNYDGEEISSTRVIAEVYDKQLRSNKATESAKRRWEKHANAMRTQCEGNAFTRQDKTIHENASAISEEERIEARLKTAEKFKPKWEDFEAWGDANNYPFAAMQEYYHQLDAVGWVNGAGQPIHKWKSHIAGWMRRRGHAK